MRKDKYLVIKSVSIGFALSASLFAAAVVYLWDSPPLWEFFLYESLPYYENRPGERLYLALPWTPGDAEPPPDAEPTLIVGASAYSEHGNH